MVEEILSNLVAYLFGRLASCLDEGEYHYGEVSFKLCLCLLELHLLGRGIHFVQCLYCGLHACYDSFFYCHNNHCFDCKGTNFCCTEEENGQKK